MPWGSLKDDVLSAKRKDGRGKPFHLTEGPELSVQRLLGSTQPTDILYAELV